MPESAQWEYRVQTVGSFLKEPKDEELEIMLNEWAQEGWELVSAFSIENSNKVKVIARRPMTSQTRRQRTWPGA